MVSASGGISNRMVGAGVSLRVSGIHDMAQHALSHELLDAACPLVPSLPAVGNFLPDIVVEVSSSHQTGYNKVNSVVVCSLKCRCERP